LDAIWEDGVFKPVKPLDTDLKEGQRVRLTVEPAARLSPDEMLELAFQVYDGLPKEEIAEIERIALDRTGFLRDEEHK
jgi:predicted DNA-binding antitoxin AbrB/MazE fold protein